MKKFSETVKKIKEYNENNLLTVEDIKNLIEDDENNELLESVDMDEVRKKAKEKRKRITEEFEKERCKT